MAKIEVLLPAMGEGIIEATITKWLAEKGSTVEEDDPIVEIATDKVDSEVPAPVSGSLVRLLFDEGDVPKVGDVIAIIETSGTSPEIEEKEESPQKESLQKQESKRTTDEEIPEVKNEFPETDKFLSPLVRSIIKEESISSNELESIQGTGLHNRITKEDMMQFLSKRNEFVSPQKKEESKAVIKPEMGKTEEVASNGSYDIIEMDRMRKLIADHMVKSKQVSPHVTSFVEADVTNLVNWRNKMKDKFLQQEGEKLTFTPIFVEAVVKVMKEYPMVNVSVEGDKILVKKDVNIGMATALPSGNLIVPVIKKADKMNLSGLASQVNDLANRARNNKLQPSEIQGGTFTITNVGTFGNISGTPIINQPEVAILAVGAIKKKPAVLETEDGDVIAIRHIMVLSMSYDHRVVDGALGGMFLKRVADHLENFDKNRAI